MANPNKYSALGTFTTAITGTGTTAPTLRALASADAELGNALDFTGSSDRQIWSNWELLVTPASTPTAGSPVELYFLCAPDGTNYEYGDDAIDPSISALIFVFPVRASTTGHRITARHIRIPNCKFKPLIYNKIGQAFSNVDAQNILSYELYTEDYP